MNRIIGNIYLSSIELLNDVESLKQQKISHILSVVPGDIPNTKDFHHEQISINDDDQSIILSHFQKSFEFINSCLYPNTNEDQINVKTPHSGSILIHCHEGMSRSVSVLVGYLMKYYKLSLDQAIYAINRRKEIQINPWFYQQLELYQEIGCDLRHHSYKQFLIEANQGDYRKVLQLLDQSGASLHQQETTLQQDDTKTGLLRCKLCRHQLATTNHLIYHTPPDQDSHQSKFFKKQKNSKFVFSTANAATICSHYFINDPLQWMAPILAEQELEGKFSCPNDKCHNKIGGYSWKGSRCSCGKWIIPAFHLLTAKVDLINRT